MLNRRAGSTPLPLRAGARLALWVLLGLLSSTQAARADRGAELLERGLDLREQGRDAEALPLFEEAYRLSPTPRALAQIGLVQQALGEWVEAERRLVAALEATSDGWIRRHRKPLSEALAAVRERLGNLQVLGTPAGAEVRFGGRVIGTLPMAVSVRVVAQRGPIVVVAPRHLEMARTVEVKPGGTVVERVALEPEPDTPPARDSFDAALREARDKEKGESFGSTGGQRVAALRAKPRATIGGSLGMVLLPDFAVHWDREGQFYADYGEDLSATLAVDGGVRYALSPRWELMARATVWASFSASTVITIEAGLGARVRPVSMSSPWFLVFELSGGTHLPMGTVEGIGFDPQTQADTTARGTPEGSFFMGVTVGTGFVLDAEEDLDLSLLIGARIDSGHDEIDDMLGPYFAIRLGYAF